MKRGGKNKRLQNMLQRVPPSAETNSRHMEPRNCYLDRQKQWLIKVSTFQAFAAKPIWPEGISVEFGVPDGFKPRVPAMKGLRGVVSNRLSLARLESFPRGHVPLLVLGSEESGCKVLQIAAPGLPFMVRSR